MEQNKKKIETALISVFHKDGLDEILKLLHKGGVKLISTGGTADHIEKLGYPCTRVEELTGYPSIFGGRVKTLHPKVFGGILNRRGNTKDHDDIRKYKIPEIDLVIVDLYPFEKTVASDADEATVIEDIDIGGISLIRAAAKNFEDVVIVSSQEQYPYLEKILSEKGPYSTWEQRKWFTKEAFRVSSGYDAAIFNYFNDQLAVPEPSLRIALDDGEELRYGENPHQGAMFYRFTSIGVPTLADAEKLQGKEISYNNLLDADAARKVVSEVFHLTERSSVAVIKHGNPCGLAVSDSLLKALELAWAGDPVSALGSIISFSGTVTPEIAEWFADKFIEVIIAPEFTIEALDIFSKKKNVRLLEVPLCPQNVGEKTFRSVSGGLLVQDEDEGLDVDFIDQTQNLFPSDKIQLARFGTVACKYLKSNAIALVSKTADGDFWLTGAGMGQPNRVDSLQQLAIPRFNQKEGANIGESILISDAFFPLRDSIDVCHKYGIKYIVQPGGSIKDREVIDACKEYGISMVFTGRRHFRH